MTVYKIGGSLFDFPRLADLGKFLLDCQPPGESLFVIGGGAAADAVRHWDRTYHLGETVSHELALGALDLTGQLFSKLVFGLRLVRSPKQAALARSEGVAALLCASCFMKAIESEGLAIVEQSWRVTSDSLAALAARVIEADRLVLVKSVDAPQTNSLAEAARSSLVDEAFPESASRMREIGWLNARVEPWSITTWIGDRSAS